MAIVDNEVGGQGYVLEGVLETCKLSDVLPDHSLLPSQEVDQVQA